MMNNYLNHNRDVFKTKLNRQDYWDFHLSCDTIGSFIGDSSNGSCLYVHIDTEDPDCVWFDNLFSKNDAVWEKAFNNGVVLDNIGYTGVDNGLVKYEKDSTSNEKFMNIFLNSRHELKRDDLRLTLARVDGNNQLYSYKNDIVEEDNMTVARLNGGFYQGFWKTEEGYQTMDGVLGNGWGFEFILKKENLINEEVTLNDVHSENRGMFFYMGTRAENKWWTKYDVDETFEKSSNGFVVDGYVNDEYFSIGLNADYAKEFVEESKWSDSEYMDFGDFGKPFSDSYVKEEYQDPDNTGCCNNVFDGEYLGKEHEIDVDMKLETSDGYDVYQPNIFEYRTDNKFIFFNKTEDGFDVKSWNEDDEVVITDIKIPDMENYFILMNKTCDGHDVHSIEEVIRKNSRKYDVLNDLYRNAFALQITDNGSVGYKYLVRDCENGGYKTESEFSKENIVNDGKWSVIHVSIVPIGKIYDCENNVNGKMRLYIYVDGKLRLVSRELPSFMFRKLDDLYSKQEAVPYNISLGGGTQGLCDAVYLNFRETPKHVLPLENEFAGTFIGYMRSFKAYDCPLTFNEITGSVEKFRQELSERKN